MRGAGAISISLLSLANKGWLCSNTKTFWHRHSTSAVGRYWLCIARSSSPYPGQIDDIPLIQHIFLPHNKFITTFNLLSQIQSERPGLLRLVSFNRSTGTDLSLREVRRVHATAGQP
jgi:hypothetical protein